MSESNKTSAQIPVYPFDATTHTQTAGDFNLQDSVRQTLQTFSAAFSDQTIDVSVDIPENLSFATDGTLFDSAVRCLCEQAIKKMPNGGELVITAVAQNHAIELEFADSRKDYVESPRLFDGKDVQDPVDALRPVYEFAAIHGGGVREQNCPEGGIAFTIHLPLIKALRSAA